MARGWRPGKHCSDSLALQTREAVDEGLNIVNSVHVVVAHDYPVGVELQRVCEPDVAIPGEVEIGVRAALDKYDLQPLEDISARCRESAVEVSCRNHHNHVVVSFDLPYHRTTVGPVPHPLQYALVVIEAIVELNQIVGVVAREEGIELVMTRCCYPAGLGHSPAARCELPTTEACPSRTVSRILRG